MNFSQLTYVLEISRCGSINKAAKKLLISQSSVSTAIRELEQELSVTLFERNNRGVSLTRPGKEFLEYAISILDQKEHVENIYKNHRDTSPMRFSVATQRYPFSEDAFIRLIRGMQTRRFHFSIKELGMDSVIDEVYDHRCDLGVIFLSRMTEKYILRLLELKGIAFHEIVALQPSVFMRRGHPLALKKKLSPADLEGYMYVSFEHDQGVAIDFSEEIRLLSFKKPSQIINVNDRATAVNVIASTDAISSGSGLIVEEFMDTRMISVPLDGEDSMRLGYIWAKNWKLSGAAQEFIRLLEQSIFDAIDFTNRVRSELYDKE
ncbi:LysR family transcriptional regulator [Eubacteriales bacterium OttesenSCG-928-K08]|nr:LysR family transcriptional regulator [Eubacteriales bacterium OttesenSCG-928-K08]